MSGNTVGIGEIARCEQFLLFPQCFQKAYFPGASKGVIVWEWVKAGTITKGDEYAQLPLTNETGVQISSKGNNSVKIQ